jgi:hypothetical protein
MKYVLWALLALIIFALGYSMSQPSNDPALSSRIDRLEKDNQLQQQMITDLGDKFAAHQHR